MNDLKKEINIIKALGDETRLRILKLLLKRELCVCELEAALNLTQSKISRHLTVLRSTGLVKDRRDGQWIFYSLFRSKDAFGNSLIQIIRNSLSESVLVEEDKRRLEKKLSQKYAYKCK